MSSIIGEIILSRWNEEIDWRWDNSVSDYDPRITNNRDFIVIEITKQIEKYWGEHKNMKRPEEFDGVLWEYNEVGVEIEYQLYWDNEGDWYYSVVVYPLGIWDQPVLPDMEECCELVITIDQGSIKSAIRDKKLEILGV